MKHLTINSVWHLEWINKHVPRFPHPTVGSPHPMTRCQRKECLKSSVSIPRKTEYFNLPARLNDFKTKPNVSVWEGRTGQMALARRLQKSRTRATVLALHRHSTSGWVLASIRASLRGHPPLSRCWGSVCEPIKAVDAPAEQTGTWRFKSEWF